MLCYSAAARMPAAMLKLLAEPGLLCPAWRLACDKTNKGPLLSFGALFTNCSALFPCRSLPLAAPTSCIPQVVGTASPSLVSRHMHTITDVPRVVAHHKWKLPCPKAPESRSRPSAHCAVLQARTRAGRADDITFSMPIPVSAVLFRVPSSSCPAAWPMLNMPRPLCAP